ncbi:MAG: caspase family protein [Acidobacteriota bacterium]|nr:caspase family protein [Acidobacteriota bacterium]
MFPSIRHFVFLVLICCCFDCLISGEYDRSKKSAGRSNEGSRFALLVGINDYDKASLKGCVNDMRVLSKVLIEHYGFSPEAVQRLEDGAATRRAILDGLDDLAKRAKKDTALVFAYAGHGKPWPDKDGDERNGYDETICPSDHDREGGGLISDDELYPRFKRILDRGAHLTVLLDACFSGDAFKDPTGIRQLRAPTVGRPGNNGEEEGGFWLGRELADHGRLVFVAAADEREVAGEGMFQGDLPGHHGYFSHTLLRLLTQPKPGRDWNHIKPYLRSGVRALKPDQNPVFLGGGLNNEIFGTRDSDELGRYRVADSKNGGAAITLEAGRTAGLSPGDQLALIGSDGKQQPVTYRIETVSAVEAKAVRIEGAEPVRPGSVLRLVHAGVLDKQPKVFLASNLPKDLVTGLTASLATGPRVAESKEERNALDLHIGRQGDDFVITGPPGRYTVPAAKASAEVLAQHLRRSVRWTILRELVNDDGQELPAAQRPLVTLERGKIRRGRFVPGPPLTTDPEQGTFFPNRGDVLRIQVTNRARRNLYVTVFYMQRDTTISALDDLSYRGALKPGKVQTFEEMILLENTGPEFIKVLYSTEGPIDPSYFTQTKSSNSGAEPPSGWGAIDLPLFVEAPK